MTESQPPAQPQPAPQLTPPPAKAKMSKPKKLLIWLVIICVFLGIGTWGLHEWGGYWLAEFHYKYDILDKPIETISLRMPVFFLGKGFVKANPRSKLLLHWLVHRGGEMFPLAVDATRSEDSGIRFNGLRMLRYISFDPKVNRKQKEESLALFVDALDDSVEENVRGALLGLSFVGRKINHSGRLRALIGMIKTGPASLKLNAMGGFVGLATLTDEVFELLERMTADTDVEVRGQAITTLTERKRGLPAILTCVDDEYPFIALEAIRSIGIFAPSGALGAEAVAALKLVSKTGTPELKWAVAGVLSMIRTPDNSEMDLALNMLKDKNQSVQEAALLALVDITGREGRKADVISPWIIPFLKKYSALKTPAVHILRNIKDPAAIQSLEQALEKERNADLREEIEETLKILRNL